MNKLHVDSVTKSYSRKKILNGVFLSCEKGEIKGLIGRNGCGKSTLLKIVFGVEKSDFKFVKVGNKRVKNIADGRNLINYLPQENFLPSNVKVKTLITLFLTKENRKYLFENEFVKELLDKKSQELSGGEKRIFEILLIIHSNADFILLDEPFNGLSPILRSYIIKYIKELKISKGFIINDHDYENVIEVADKILFLKDGSLKEIKERKELVQLGYLSKAML